MCLPNLVFILQTISLVWFIKNNIIIGERDDKMIKCIESCRHCKTIFFLSQFFFGWGCYYYVLLLFLNSRLLRIRTFILFIEEFSLIWGGIQTTLYNSETPLLNGGTICQSSHKDIRIILLSLLLGFSFSYWLKPLNHEEFGVCCFYVYLCVLHIAC